MKILVTEDQLKNIVVPFFNEKNEQLSEFKENWSTLNVEQKELVLELYKTLHPEKRKQIDEGLMDWIQTGLDIGGIFDPTGMLDLTNSVIYFTKGEVLFGMLSLVAAVPYIGDAVAKPVLLAAKAGAKEFKLVSVAVKTKDATKISKAVNLVKDSKVGGIIFKFFENFTTGLGKKILGILEKAKKIPIVGKFFSTIEEWINLFKKAATEMKVPTKGGFTMVSRGLSGPEKVAWGETLKQMFKPFSSKYGTTVFKDLAKAGKLPSNSLSNIYKNIMRVPQTRKLMGKTKMFLRFLDHLGIANTVGPEELTNMIPDADQKFADFAKTSEGMELFNNEIASFI